MNEEVKSPSKYSNYIETAIPTFPLNNYYKIKENEFKNRDDKVADQMLASLIRDDPKAVSKEDYLNHLARQFENGRKKALQATKERIEKDKKYDRMTIN